MEKAKTDFTPLQARVTREIIALVRRENRRAGDAMPEVLLAESIGTSRSPVQVALRYLASIQVVRQDSNRRYVLARDAVDLDDLVKQLSAEPDDPLYLQIADAVQTGTLSGEASEAQLMRTFKVARSTLRKVMARISEEGWAEQRIGSGWTFLPTIDSPQAYEESYLLRQAIEPSGLLSPWFKADRKQLMELRKEQQLIAGKGYQTMTAIELFEANSRFHETIALWSGNRFTLQTVRRLNQLRRLVEYRQAITQRPARKTQSEEHLSILDAIEKQDLIEAAGLMRKHLEDARRAKVYGSNIFQADPSTGLMSQSSRT